MHEGVVQTPALQNRGQGCSARNLQLLVDALKGHRLPFRLGNHIAAYSTASADNRSHRRTVVSGDVWKSTIFRRTSLRFSDDTPLEAGYRRAFFAATAAAGWSCCNLILLSGIIVQEESVSFGFAMLRRFLHDHIKSM